MLSHFADFFSDYFLILCTGTIDMVNYHGTYSAAFPDKINFPSFSVQKASPTRRGCCMSGSMHYALHQGTQYT